MKILFLLNGHFDSGLELFSYLKRLSNIFLVLQIESDRIKQSIIEFDASEISLGLSKVFEIKNDFINHLENLISIDKNKTFILKYNSSSLRDLRNFKVSFEFSKWVRNENFDIIHYYGSSLTWVQQILFLKKIKKIFTIHDYVPHYGDYLGSGYQYKFYMFFITKLIKAHYLLLSRKMLEEFKSYYKVKFNKCDYINFGTFNVYKKYENENNVISDFDILFFGRISPYKGIEYLVEATQIISQKMPYIKTVIAGSGQFYFDIDKIKNDDKFIIYNHYIKNELLVSLIKSSKIVVCPYIDASQSGVVMTAYTFNKPVIATDVGSFREYVIDNETGFIVQPKNALSLSDAIIKLLSNSKLYNYMQEKIEYYKKISFNWKNSAQRIVSIYNKL